MDIWLLLSSILVPIALFILTVNLEGQKENHKRLQMIQSNLHDLEKRVERVVEATSNIEVKIQNRAKTSSIKYQAIKDELNDLKRYLEKIGEFYPRKNLILDSDMLDEEESDQGFC